MNIEINEKRYYTGRPEDVSCPYWEKGKDEHEKRIESALPQNTVQKSFSKRYTEITLRISKKMTYWFSKNQFIIRGTKSTDGTYRPFCHHTLMDTLRYLLASNNKSALSNLMNTNHSIDLEKFRSAFWRDQRYVTRSMKQLFANQ